MVEVKTEEELKEALKRKESEIIVVNEELVLKIKRFKKIKNISKWTLISAGVILAVAAASIPATGGASAPVAYALVAEKGAEISAETVVAIGAMIFLGFGLLLALYKNYDVIEVSFTPPKIKLLRKSAQKKS